MFLLPEVQSHLVAGIACLEAKVRDFYAICVFWIVKPYEWKAENRNTPYKISGHGIVPYQVEEKNSCYKKQPLIRDEKDGVKYSYAFFHVIFIFASLHIMMQLTNWNRWEQGRHATNNAGAGRLWHV